MDFIYVVTALAFFAAMLAYVKACHLLGGRAEREARKS